MAISKLANLIKQAEMSGFTTGTNPVPSWARGIKSIPSANPVTDEYNNWRKGKMINRMNGVEDPNDGESFFDKRRREASGYTGDTFEQGEINPLTGAKTMSWQQAQGQAIARARLTPQKRAELDKLKNLANNPGLAKKNVSDLQAANVRGYLPNQPSIAEQNQQNFNQTRNEMQNAGYTKAYANGVPERMSVANNAAYKPNGIRTNQPRPVTTNINSRRTWAGKPIASNVKPTNLNISFGGSRA